MAGKTITAEQANALGLTAALFELLGGAADLVAAIRANKFAELGGATPTALGELVKIAASTWTALFEKHASSLAAGTTAASLGGAVASRLAIMFPSSALANALPAVNGVTTAAALDELAPLYKLNPRVVGASFASLKTTGLTNAQIARFARTHEVLVRWSNAYPGLGLGALLDDTTQPTKLRGATAQKRAELLIKALHTAGDRVFRLDLANGGAGLARLGLDKLGATADEQQMVLAAVRAYQRVWVVTESTADLVTVVSAGFASAHAIAKQPLAAFQQASGLPAAMAQTAWQSARTVMADTALAASGMLDAVHGLFDQTTVGNQPAVTAQYLAQIPGYQDMFGSLAFCDCDECQSILGPAAYFVDLMKFIDENVRPIFSAHPHHPLDLKTRRPDLWTLELSCDAIDRRIATLDIVNEVLENYVAARLGYTGSLGDRNAVGAVVYGALATAVDSFTQPFDLARARSNAYLSKIGQTRAAVATALGATSGVRARAELELSVREEQVATTPIADLAQLGHIYGISFGGSAAAVADVDAAVLGWAMDLTRAELGQVVATAFVAAAGAHPSIRAAKRTAASVQADVEWVHELTADALDRMHRLTRIARKMGWTIPDVDLALSTLGDSTLATVQNLAGIHAVRARFAVTTAEACALVGPMPQPLVDSAFNTASFVAATGGWPAPTQRFTHPAFLQNTAGPVDPALARLTAGLGVDLDGLASLARHLAPHLAQEASPGFDPNAANEADRYFVLSAANLTLLYRHARLAQLLGLPVEDLFQLASFAGLDSVRSLSDLLVLLDGCDWWRTSGYALDDVAVVLGQPPRDPARYLDPVSVAAQIVETAATSIDFSETVFAAALGTTEQASLDLLAANPAVVEPSGRGMWRLVAGVELATIAITLPASAVVLTPPAGTRPVTADEVRAALAPHVPGDVLVRALGAAFGLTTDKLIALAALAHSSTSSDAVVRAVRGDGPIAPLVALISALKPLAVALAAPCWDGPAIDFVSQHAAVFGAGAMPVETPDAGHPNVPRFTLEQLRSIATCARVAARSSSGTVGPDLRAALAAFDPSVPGFAPASDAQLTNALGAPAGIVVGLRGQAVLPGVAAAALEQLDQAVQLAVVLGIDGDSLGALISDNETALSHAADALYSAIGAGIADPAARAMQFDAAEQPVREAKRDALVDYLIHSITPHEWDTPDELYEYFLIDVEAGGCSTTSRVVSAITTAQLYVHRASLNLERDAASDLVLALSPDALKQWAWRQTYRAWQANREVFLWPENYLDPDLRDDKTPPFHELEQTLLQTNIDDQNVLDAYTAYLASLEELATLKIAGAYHDRSASPDVLHLFGAAATDPPTYYYRTCQNLSNARPRDHRVPVPTWSPWQKVSVQITGRKVSPVVHQGRLYLFWVETQSRSVSRIQSGASVFSGYQHTMSLRFTILRSDGTWTAPQSVALPIDVGGDPASFAPNAGQINDPVKNGVAQLDPLRRTYPSAGDPEPIDGYTLSGPNWDYAWMVPQGDSLFVQLRDFMVPANVDLFARTTSMAGAVGIPPAAPYPRLLCAKNGGTTRPLLSGTPYFVFYALTPFANAVAEQRRLDVADLDVPGMANAFHIADYGNEIATISADADVLAVPGCEEDMIVQEGADPLLVQGSVFHSGAYVLRRLGTTLVARIARELFEQGLDYTLSTPAQLALAEAGLPITPVGTLVDRSGTGTIDYSGPFGIYFRELFFHIPHLIGNALSSNGNYAAAQRWFQFIFDPTSTEQIDVTGLPPEQAAHRLLDRVWRYREFRGLDVSTLREILTDSVALNLYQEDPFNPWAIARRRISAFQKAVVMRYVGNILDWADSLFTQFTMETVNEAMMLYVMAEDILGPRPVEIGDCGAGVKPNDYATIGPLIDGTDDFLVELETWAYGSQVSKLPTRALEAAPLYAYDRAAIVGAAQAVPLGAPLAGTRPATGLGSTSLRTASWGPALAGSKVKTTDKLGGRTFEQGSKNDFAAWAAPFGWAFVRQVTPAFCVPVNHDLLALWDRVADRLYKLRHCEDINGNPAELALFAPPLNPADLSAIEAAGLTLADVLGSTSGNLPPYRFSYLIDRAKVFASNLASFGGALLSSLEKKDTEHLTRVRLTQQMNLARLTTQSRQLEIQAATAALTAAQAQLRATGECRFTIPEVFFDLFYPGHYKRRIRSVRLTIPCVTASYVNVGAQLELEQSWVRASTKPDAALAAVPPSRSIAVATSTAQNDAGVFELSFRDERYMPFEGLGAISQWHLLLPKSFRQFDYETIKDVIVSISYEAVADSELRDRVETQNATLQGAILQYLATNGAKRAFSLRQDFSTAFTRLLRSAAGTSVTFEIGDRNFPLFVAGRALAVTRGAVLLRTASGAVPTGFTLAIDGAAVSAFSADATLGDFPAAPLPSATTANMRAQHTMTVTAAGDLAPATLPPGDTSALDSAKLLDILLYLEYRLA